MTVSPIPVDSRGHWSRETASAHKQFILDSLMAVETTHRRRCEDKLQRWDRLYRGVPQERERSTPWPNASNVVVQVVGQHTDTLTARIMGSIYEMTPLWPVKARGITQGTPAETERKRSAIEEMLQEFALDPHQLDLYRVEQLWFSDAIKYGFKVVKTAVETSTEQHVSGDGAFPIHVTSGPRPENVNYEDFIVSNSYRSIEDAPFKAERLYFTRQDIERRRDSGKFAAKAVETVLAASPDDQGQSRWQRLSSDNPLASPSSDNPLARWHIYECWTKFYALGKTWSTVSYVHLATRTLLGAWFNYLPNNIEPYCAARLGYRTSDMYGVGFCELLEHAQVEATSMHNRRNDNATIANLHMFRVSPKAIRFGGNIKLQPMSILRADAGEIEPLAMGTPYSSTIEEEQLLLQEASDRSGTSPAVAGTGGGTMNRRGVYSSQGTFAVLNDGNRRVNLDTMDMRYSHARLGRTLLDLYAHFGLTGSQYSAFGSDAADLRKALDEYAQGKFGVSVRSATSSLNRELDRQNDVYLTQIFNRHFMAMGQLLQSVIAPQTPRPMKEYLVRVISASDTLMNKVARSFGLENASTFLPQAPVVTQITSLEDSVAARKQRIQNVMDPAARRNPPGAGEGPQFGQKPPLPNGGGTGNVPEDELPVEAG